MIKDIPLRVALHSYKSSSTPLTSQRLVNMFAEKAPDEAKNGGMALLGSSGLKLNTIIGDGPIYGSHKMGSLVYWVSGNNVYTLNSSGTINNLGSVGTVSGGVIMADDGITVVINLPSGASYLATATTLTQITDADYVSSSSVAVLDGFTLFANTDTRRYQGSTLLDASAYDALDFVTAEESSDNIVRMIANRDELWIFKQHTTEIHYDTGGAGFPFAKTSAPALDRGLAAKLAVAADANTLFWLGDDRIIYSAVGYATNRISDHGVERSIREYADISDAEAWIYTEDGHKFLVFTFPTAAATFEMDLVTGLWHERESFEIGRWRATALINAFGKNLCGDYENGNIYEIDPDTYSENGTLMQRIVTMPPVFANGKRMIHHYLYIDADSGVGLTSGQGSNPQVMLDWSNDGGYNFGNSLWRSLGAIGSYSSRLVWRRLGQARQRTYRIIYSEKTKFNITGGYLSTTVGSS